MTIEEKLIANNMSKLGCSRQEAIDLIAFDASVDRMTSTSEIDSDLSAEQRQNAKTARQADRKPVSYNFSTAKRKRAEKPDRRYIIDVIQKALEENGCENITITNAEREITFAYGVITYKVVLSAPTKSKMQD